MESLFRCPELASTLSSCKGAVRELGISKFASKEGLPELPCVLNRDIVEGIALRIPPRFPARCPFSPLFWVGRFGSPTKIDTEKVGTLMPTSNWRRVPLLK